MKTIISVKLQRSHFKSCSWKPFASDGSILATTVMRYDAYIDFKTIKDSVYDNNIGALTDSLSQMFGKPRVHYRKIFDEQKRRKINIFHWLRGLDFDQYDRIKKFPIFSKKIKNREI